MKTVVLHGPLMTGRDAAHREIARTLGIPEFEGKHLEALPPLLAGLPPMRIIWQGRGHAAEVLGDYADRIEAMLGTPDHLTLETD